MCRVVQSCTRNWRRAADMPISAVGDLALYLHQVAVTSRQGSNTMSAAFHPRSAAAGAAPGRYRADRPSLFKRPLLRLTDLGAWPQRAFCHRPQPSSMVQDFAACTAPCHRPSNRLRAFACTTRLSNVRRVPAESAFIDHLTATTLCFFMNVFLFVRWWWSALSDSCRLCLGPFRRRDGASRGPAIRLAQRPGA